MQAIPKIIDICHVDCLDTYYIVRTQITFPDATRQRAVHQWHFRPDPARAAPACSAALRETRRNRCRAAVERAVATVRQWCADRWPATGSGRRAARRHAASTAGQRPEWPADQSRQCRCIGRPATREDSHDRDAVSRHRRAVLCDWKPVLCEV